MKLVKKKKCKKRPKFPQQTMDKHHVMSFPGDANMAAVGGN